VRPDAPPPLPAGEGRGEEETIATIAETLRSAQAALRSRFEDFRRALDRRDEEAYRLGLADFHSCLLRWTEAQEKALLPAVLRAGVAGRDPRRELRLEWVQLRELTRYLLSQVLERAPIADILGFTENLARRFTAHESDLEKLYYAAAASTLTPEEWRILANAAPSG
jgi:hypothetical protein